VKPEGEDPEWGDGEKSKAKVKKTRAGGRHTSSSPVGTVTP